MPAACALEMVHTYSLIHDDLPAMDDDDLQARPIDLPQGVRRGHGDPGGGRSVDAGIRVGRPRGQARGRRRCGAFRSWPRRRARRGWWPARWPTFRPKGAPNWTGHDTVDRRNLAALEAIHRRKTGALLRAPLRMGAVIAEAPDSYLEALDRYGKAVGLAFQIVDDLLDVQGDETKLGKRVGKDSELGKWTYPRFLGVDGSRRRARQLADEAVAALEPLGPGGHRLRSLALALLERDR